jgi:hypothetical protein
VIATLMVGVVGGQFNGATEVAKRIIKLAQLAKGDAEVVMGSREVGPKLQGAAELLGGLSSLRSPDRGPNGSPVRGVSATN